MGRAGVSPPRLPPAGGFQPLPEKTGSNYWIDTSLYSDVSLGGGMVPQRCMPGVMAMAEKQRGSGATAKLTSLESLGEAAECLKTLAHPHRLRIVQMLLKGRYTVGELADACGIPSHMASEHLRLMQRCGFLDVEKEGRRVYYTIAEPHLASIMACIEDRFGGEPKPRTNPRS